MGTQEARAIDDLPARFNAAEDLLAGNLALRPDKVAIIDHRGACTYRELGDRIARMAGVFAALGVGRGDRVLLCLTDTRDFHTVFLGAMWAGVVPVPLNTLMTADDYAWIVDHADAAAVFVSGERADPWVGIAADRPCVRFVSSESGPWPDLETMVAAADPVARPAPTHREDIAFWLLTSGSTGWPKGAMHMHGSLRLTANLFGIGTLGLREDDLVLSIAKLFFAYGLGTALAFPLAAGATVLLHNGRATPDAVNALFAQHEISVLGAVPTFLAGWLADAHPPARQMAARLRVATSAGEALPAEIGRAFEARFAAPCLDGLGSTEMLHIFVSQRPGDVRYGCTGRPVPGYRVRVVADDGGDAAPGEIGTLYVSGPTAATAYWHNRAKSLATFRGEWTMTGDKYSMDADGWLTYAGRADDMLKVGGIYVSPAEVEGALASHDDVLEAAVVGREAPDALVKPHGYVVLKPGVVPCDALKAGLQDHVKQRLAPYKYPRWISFVDDLPKTATGKIQRFKLREPQ